MEGTRRRYIPAAGHDRLLPLYDPLCRWMGAEELHRQLVRYADIRPGQRILEIGCGTGNLALLVKRLHPGAEVVALDPDPKALARAREKAAGAAVAVHLDRGFAEDLPYAEGSFDRVLSAFMLHHLEPPDKERSLNEARRVVARGGSLHVLDFAGGLFERVARLLHGGPGLRANTDERLVTLMGMVGFVAPAVIGHRVTIFGRVAYYRAAVPGPQMEQGDGAHG